MRLPAVAISAALACGTVLGLHPAVARNTSSRGLLLICSLVVAVLIRFPGAENNIRWPKRSVTRRCGERSRARNPGGKRCWRDAGGCVEGLPSRKQEFLEAEFLAAVTPRVGIISAGEYTPFGHPSQELLECLETRTPGFHGPIAMARFMS